MKCNYIKNENFKNMLKMEKNFIIKKLTKFVAKIDIFSFFNTVICILSTKGRQNAKKGL